MTPPPQEARADSTRRQVLEALQAAPSPQTVGVLAEELGVHPNTIRFHLERLVADEVVDAVEPEGPRRPGRPARAFRARGRMDPHGPRDYRLLASILLDGFADDPEAGERALDAGRAWGSRLAAEDTAGKRQRPVRRLAGMLADIGFDPEIGRAREGKVQMALRHCPFLELAQNREGVVCPIHLGLMQGALAEMEADVQVDRLEPFVRPDRCLAHLSTLGSGA